MITSIPSKILLQSNVASWQIPKLKYIKILARFPLTPHKTSIYRIFPAMIDDTVGSPSTKTGLLKPTGVPWPIAASTSRPRNSAQRLGWSLAHCRQEHLAGSMNWSEIDGTSIKSNKHINQLETNPASLFLFKSFCFVLDWDSQCFESMGYGSWRSGNCHLVGLLAGWVIPGWKKNKNERQLGLGSCHVNIFWDGK